MSPEALTAPAILVASALGGDMVGESDGAETADEAPGTAKVSWFSAITVRPRKGLGIVGDTPPPMPARSPERAVGKRRRFRK